MNIEVSMTELILSLSRALDVVSPAVMDHGLKVAYIALALGREMGFDAARQEEVLLAGALHDVGVLSLEEKIELHQFEVEETATHTELGFRLLSLLEPLSSVATTVRYHHLPWNHAAERAEGEIPLSSHVIHLADRMSVLPKRGRNILDQVAGIRQAALEESGKLFNPDVVDAFMRVSEKEYFWFDLTSGSLVSLFAAVQGRDAPVMRMLDLMELADLYAHVIDFRSHFTATHSTGVAATAARLARLSGFSDDQRDMMRVAGLLHDIGKLAVPVEILEKPSRLSRRERNVVMVHPYWSFHILKSIAGLDIINAWGSFHHERVDGSGYPFHLGARQLTMGSRLMAVADVFTAASEDRPYRKGMSPESVKRLLRRMSETAKLDEESVRLLTENFDEVWSVREDAQSISADIYDDMPLWTVRAKPEGEE